MRPRRIAWANEWLKRNAAGGGAYQVSIVPQRSGRAHAQRGLGQRPEARDAAGHFPDRAGGRNARRAGRARCGRYRNRDPAERLRRVAQRGTARAIAIPMRNHMDFIAMNSQAAPFNDVRVRQAIAYALPYEQIFQSVFRGRGVAALWRQAGSRGRHLSAAERVQLRPRQGQGAAQGGRAGRTVSRPACSTAPARRPISTRWRLRCATRLARSAFA